MTETHFEIHIFIVLLLVASGVGSAARLACHHRSGYRPDHRQLWTTEGHVAHHPSGGKLILGIRRLCGQLPRVFADWVGGTGSELRSGGSRKRAVSIDA